MKIKEGTVIAVNHEPLSFMRRAGHASVDQERKFLQDHSEENIKKLAENGCDIVRFHFYKGFGVETEKEEIEMTREYVKLCHKYGVKVQLYIQFGTLHPETLLAEQPGMMEWVQTHSDGKPISLVYGHQNCRLYPCFNKGGYWDYLEKIIYMGIVDIGGDAIGFDNITTSEEPFVCHCSNCTKAFVSFLKEKYRPDMAEGAKLTRQRFGHTILDYIRPPEWNYFNHAYNLIEIKNPVIQEWIYFRCESLKKTLKRLYDYSKSLNPDILLEFNTYKQFGVNTAFVHGVYVPDYEDCIDVFWNESDVTPHYTSDGELFFKSRSYKMARTMGKSVFSDHPSREGADDLRRIAYAESMAFNRGMISGVDRAEGIYSGRQNAFKPYREFAQMHSGIYSSVPVANIALYESKPSLSFNNYATWYADLTMHQCLLRGHIPYDLIFRLEDLKRYDAVVLPDVECLSDDEIKCLEAYASNGGSLVLTDSTGIYDQWHRHRGDASLHDILGIDKACAKDILTANYGKGRLVYIPKLKSSRIFDPEKLVFTALGTNQPGLGREYFIAPVNQDRIIDAIWWACRDAVPIEVKAPEHVIVELAKSSENNICYLHLINYKPASEVRNIRIRLNKALIGDCSRIRVLSPDTGLEYNLAPDESGFITIACLQCYLVIEVH